MSRRRLQPELISLEDLLEPEQRRYAAVPGATPMLSGGDIDAQWEMAESIGDEAAGGSCSTPDQNVVEEYCEALGIHYEDDEPLRVGEKERARDQHRWELDPASAEDFHLRWRLLTR